MFNTQKNYELNILVGGKPITEYTHEDNTFVEGRKGREFEVEFKNKTSKQVLIVPSVDGKSVLDGEVATPDSKGYIVRAYGSIRIPGWTLDGDNVANFFFEDKEKSYASAMSAGEVVQSGVVGVLVFSEVVRVQPQPIHIHHHHRPRTPWPQYPYTPWYPGSPMDPMWYGSAIGSSDATSYNAASPASKGIMRGMAANQSSLSASNSVAQAQASLSSDTSSHENTSIPDSFELGAGFGEKSKFKTQEAQFERGTMVAQMVLFYDSRRNLEKRGIEVAKREVRHVKDLPEAFSGLGCKTPPGWQG